MKFLVSLVVSVAAVLAGCGGGGSSNDLSASSQSGQGGSTGDKPAQGTPGGNQGGGNGGAPSTAQGATWSNLSWSGVPHSFDAAVSKVFMPTVTIDQSGDLVLVYGQYDVVSRKHQSMASTRSLTTGKWSTPVVISPPNETVVDTGTYTGYLYGSNRGTTIIATDRRTGNAVVAMVTTPSTQYPLRNSIWVATYDKVAGTWSSPTRLGYQMGSGAKVETDEQGSFIVAWPDAAKQGESVVNSIYTAVFNWASRTWSQPSVINTSAQVGAITLRASKAAPAVVRMAWETNEPSGTQLNVASSSVATLTAGRWESNQLIGPGLTPALSESLDLLAYEYSGKIALRTASANVFGEPKFFAGNAYNCNPAIVNNQEGDAMLVFTSTYNSGCRSGDQYHATRQADGEWSASTLASDTTFGGRLTMLNMDESGDVLMTLHAGAPMAMRYAKASKRWKTEGMAYTGWGEYISADPVNHRAVLMWMDAHDIKIHLMMLK